MLEINELKKENEKIILMKDQYKDYYEKMRNGTSFFFFAHNFPRQK